MKLAKFRILIQKYSLHHCEMLFITGFHQSGWEVWYQSDYCIVSL